LSEVLFVATANFLQYIPAPLLDPMEVVDFSGYTEREKAEIAKTYLIPTQLAESGLADEHVSFTDDALGITLATPALASSSVESYEGRAGFEDPAFADKRVALHA
jgi:ATP-dependent Lon protease